MNGGAFELFEPLDPEAAVPRARCDHDGLRLDPFPSPQLNVAWGVAAFELHRLIRDEDLDSELLSLAERAAHERHTGDSGRKAEVILDPRRSARLTAERTTIDREHRHAF